jgi:GTP-binding protein LepA
MASGKKFEVTEVGWFYPGPTAVKELQAGDVGYICASIKNVKDCTVGDTITSANNPTETPLDGYKKSTPMVYCGVYPAEGESYDEIRDALEKLQLNDAALTFEAETSVALGFGFRCGFLGLLHLEIIQQRLHREFNLDLIATAPSVIYRVTKTDGEVIMVQNPTNLPAVQEIEMMEEPIVDAHIYVPNDYVGNVMELCQNRRGVMISMDYVDTRRVKLHYELPLNEVIYDFFDALKSKTKGYGSLDYEFKEYRESDLVKLDLLLNKEMIDAFSMIVHKSKADQRGRQICEKLREVIPKHQFTIPIQAAIGNKVIARETISALRKDVLAKCYGGDISRKKKLLEKQKEGKKKMRQLGSVEVPQQAFLEVLKFDEGK